MRQIGTIPQQPNAIVFTDYLLTLGIKSQVDPEGDQWGVWIFDEDRVPQSREELSAYLQNPADPKYASANQQAAALRVQAESKRGRTNVVQIRDRWVTQRGIQPVVTVLLAISILVGVTTMFGKTNPKIVNRLLISSPEAESARDSSGNKAPQLSEVRSGQMWRLITPIFLHFGLPHIVFNLWMLQVLGNSIEFRRGSWAMLGITLAIAIGSNLIQYESSALRNQYYPGNFGGMSGVVYGLFGYAWVKGRFDPVAGLGVPQSTTIIMMIWLVVCIMGWADQVDRGGVRTGVANGAHVGGLLIGAAIALAPILWQNLKERR